MKNNITCESPLFFVGRWKKTIFCLKVDGVWKATKHYGRGSIVFTFDDESKARERYTRCTKKPTYVDYTTEYGYDPKERLLYIDQSHYEPDGFMSICVEDHYRVEAINSEEVWLYFLEDVEKEPEDYRMRMKIIRDKSY